VIRAAPQIDFDAGDRFRKGHAISAGYGYYCYISAPLSLLRLLMKFLPGSQMPVFVNLADVSSANASVDVEQEEEGNIEKHGWG
jgi:hypothetical protein